MQLVILPVLRLSGFSAFEIMVYLGYDIGMQKKLMELVVLDGMVEAEIIKAKLESQQIPCYIKFESAGRLFGITMDGLGQVRVMVPESVYEKAKQLIGIGEKKRVD